MFFRDASEVETNAFVAVSSPSSSAYESVEDLGTAEDAAKRVLEQYVGELMSTRLGVRRERGDFKREAKDEERWESVLRRGGEDFEL